MKFTHNWLSQHLQSSASSEEIIQQLTAIGLEVESVDDLAARLSPFVIAEIVEARPHPNADTLQLCMVNIGGDELVQVVCGAPNARTGLRGVFAPIGSHIPSTGLELKSGNIRGEDSNGMLCSEKELMLSDEHDGIIDLPADAPIGKQYSQWANLSEVVIEVNITPNRGDCLSIRGIARDLAAAGVGQLKDLEIISTPSQFPSPINWAIDPQVQKQACPFVMGRSFRNVNNCQSPAWLQKRLQAIGLRPISALVDITNYITFDLGRPLHVFDADKLSGEILTMRFAHKGEKITALDGKNYTLDNTMTVIGDAKNSQAIGGIIGGQHSGCTEKTKNVFLEAALFSPLTTAATGRKLTIESDARYRFERGIDSNFIAQAIDIASHMIIEICGGQASEITTAGNNNSSPKSITLTFQQLKDFSGVNIPPKQATNILQHLGFSVTNDNKKITATPPSWRNDIEGAHCLIEEILRIYGYDKVPQVSLPAPLTPQKTVSSQQNRCQIAAQALAMRGLYEAITWSFTSQNHAEIFSYPNHQHITITNPISSQLSHMRTSILANLTQIAAKNRNRNNQNIALFEVGPAFLGQQPNQQQTHISGIRIGSFQHLNHYQPARQADLYDAKTDVIKTLQACQIPIDNLQTHTDNLPPYYHPGKSAALRLGKQTLAHFGELNPRFLQILDLPDGAAIFEIYCDNLPPKKEKNSHNRPPFKPSQLQPIYRDFAFIIEANINAQHLINAVKIADKKLIQNATIFDIYTFPSNHKTHPNKRSIALRITIQSSNKTLEDNQIDNISQAVINSAQKLCNAELRQ